MLSCMVWSLVPIPTPPYRFTVSNRLMIFLSQVDSSAAKQHTVLRSKMIVKLSSRPTSRMIRAGRATYAR